MRALRWLRYVIYLFFVLILKIFWNFISWKMLKMENFISEFFSGWNLWNIFSCSNYRKRYNYSNDTHGEWPEKINAVWNISIFIGSKNGNIFVIRWHFTFPIWWFNFKSIKLHLYPVKYEIENHVIIRSFNSQHPNVYHFCLSFGFNALLCRPVW